MGKNAVNLRLKNYLIEPYFKQMMTQTRKMAPIALKSPV